MFASSCNCTIPTPEVKGDRGPFFEVSCRVDQVRVADESAIIAIHTHPESRVVLLGASNLTRGISTVVGMSGRLVGGPCAFLIAMGHGRSYGQRSNLLGRTIPGIVECGLWEALRAGGGPTRALITDIGNDVMYGVHVETITGWVAECIDRLRAAGANGIILTLPPVASIEKLTPWRYRIARSLIFPGRRLTLKDATARCRGLSEQLAALGAEAAVAVVEPDPGWYGLDPIHPRRRQVDGVWQRTLGEWNSTDPGPVAASRSPARWARLKTLTPQRWWLLGREMGRPQPSGRLTDGTTLSLF